MCNGVKRLSKKEIRQRDETLLQKHERLRRKYGAYKGNISWEVLEREGFDFTDDEKVRLRRIARRDEMIVQTPFGITFLGGKAEKVMVEIKDYADFYTIWIKDEKTGQYMPLGKQWRKSETAEKWAEKIKKEYESQGFKVSIERSRATLKVKPSKVIFEKKVPKDVDRV